MLVGCSLPMTCVSRIHTMLANKAEWKHLRCSLTTQAVNGCVMVVVYFIHDLHAAGIRCTSYQHPSVAHGLKESYGHLILSLKMCQGCGAFHDLHFLMVSVPTPGTQVNLWIWRGTMACDYFILGSHLVIFLSWRSRR